MTLNPVYRSVCGLYCYALVLYTFWDARDTSSTGLISLSTTVYMEFAGTFLAEEQV
jgi:hypothetical protein